MHNTGGQQPRTDADGESDTPGSISEPISAEAADTPVSGFQEQIWLHGLLEPGTGLYSVPLAWRRRGRPLDASVLRMALADVVARHEILRTRFVERAGRLRQIVTEPWTPPLIKHDLTGVPRNERESQLHEWLEEAARQPFDLASGRLLRAALIDLADEEQVLFVHLHHLVWDLGSQPVFLRDLDAAYAAHAADDEQPATPHQERMAFTEQFETGVVYDHAPIYHNLPLLLRLGWTPGEDEVRSAVAEVLNRHPALRTTLLPTGDGYVQRVTRDANVCLDWLPVGPDAPAEPEGAAEAAPDDLLAWVRRPFDLAAGPLFRAAVRPRAEGGCWLALVGHLAVVDRASLELVADEVLRLLREQPLPPPEPGGFAKWWAGRDQAALQRDLDLRAKQIGEDIEPLRLPERTARAAVHVYEEQSVPLTLPGDLDLAGLAARCEAPVDAVLLAGLAATLAWYSGQDDVAVGTVADRRVADTAGLVGPVADFAPLRLVLEPRQGFDTLVRSAAAELAAARAGGAPFDQLVRRLDPAKDMSRMALFDVLFQYLPAPDFGPGTAVVETGGGYGKYDIHLFLRSEAGRTGGRIVFNGLYYDAEQMRALAQHYIRMLRLALADPEAPVDTHEPLTGQERRRQIEEWNETAAEYPDCTIVELIRRQAERDPAAIALSGPAPQSYGRLLERVDRMAAALVAEGVRPSEPVALLTARGSGQVEAILAVLAAGAMYVPIDADSPADRIEFLLQDCGARRVIADDPRDPRLTGFTGRVYRPEELAEWEGAEASVPGNAPATDALPVVDPGSAAYCIYTSGTTGRPKGVVVTHRNVVRLVANSRLPFAFGPEDVWTLFHSYAFDFSVWEIFGCLAHGGRLVVLDREDTRDPQRLCELIRREGVTVLNQTPGALARLLPLLGDETQHRLRYVILGGARFSPAMLGDWLRRNPGLSVVNMYGITETTVHSTWHVVTPEDVAADRGVVGRPIPTTTIRLLDRRSGRRLLPVGAVGEIYVGGLGVAAGYLGRPALQAERFGPDPYGEGRMYRSGDLARYLPDGSLEVVGRADDQVKVRGYRVEPGEIEACLRGHPGVRDAAVVLDPEGDRLIAYLRPADDPAEIGDVRAWLAGRLPQYLIPAVFRTLAEFPLTVNGKVDRRALAAATVPAATSGGPAPDTGTELMLARLWSRVLRVEQVSAEDSFFALGGHSLLAASLIAEITQECGITLPIRVVFEHPRLRDQASVIDEELRRLPQERPVPSVSAAASAAPDPHDAALDTTGLVPASSFQRRVHLAERLEPDAGYLMPLVWRVHGGRVDAAALGSALSAVVARHEVLRTRFVELAGQLWQAPGEAWTPTVESVDLSGVPADEREAAWQAWVLGTARQHVDLASGRLLRCALIDLGEGGQMFVLCPHHLVCDGPSIAVLLDDLARAYGTPGTLPIAPVQYRDFVAAQEAERSTVAGRQGLAFWTRHLEGAPAQLPLRPPASAGPHGSVTVPLPIDLLDRARKARRRGTSTFMVMAVALAATLHRWTGRDDVTFGFPVANRSRQDLAEVVGPCTNTLVLRSRIGSETSLADLLDSMHRQTVDALEHQTVPFEDIVSALNPPRHPGRVPYVDVALNMATLAGRYRLGECELAYLPGPQMSAETKFALTVTVLEQDGRPEIVLSHRGDRFTAGQVARIADLLVAELGRIALEPADRVRPDAASPVPPAAVQYRDFVRAQETERATPAGRQALAYWTRYLRDAPTRLPLEPPTVAAAHGSVAVPLPADMLARTRAIPGHEGASTFMVMAAVLAATLHRWTGQDDITVGFPVANRTRPDLAEVVGPCTNTLVLRSRVDPDTALGDLLGATRRHVVDALEHQTVPFEDVINALNPPRERGRTPYLDVALVHKAAGFEPPLLHGAPLQPVRLVGAGADWLAKSPLTASFEESGDSVHCVLAYDGGRIARADAQRLAELMGRMAELVLVAPERELRSVPAVGSDELARLAAWERGPEPYSPTSVLELFAAQVAARPQAPAVVSAHGVCSYRRLDERARALAARLRARAAAAERGGSGGDGGDGVVALLAGRGEDLVVAMLGAWMAGFGYCPVDPSYPEARIAHILSDLQPWAVLTDDPSRFEPAGRYQVLALGEDEAADVVSAHDAGVAADAALGDSGRDALAYVIYTSGSTGAPKGVAIGHRALAQFAQAHRDLLQIGPADRVGHVNSIGFDASVADIWPTLCAGAALVIYGAPRLLAPGLVEWFTTAGITVSLLPAALAETVWALGTPIPSLRSMVYGGSALSAPAPSTLTYRLTNEYGPTETTVAVCSHRVDPAVGAAPSLIGRPLSGAVVYVTDDTGARRPIGLPGEIRVGGTCVARGYWRAPEHTARSFLPEGPDGSPGPVYRTGDRGRWLPDGTLEFLGRLDRQVKIDGYRIEPGEIEAALRGHPLVAGAAVRAFPNSAVRLVAYVVPVPGAARDSAAVLDMLAGQLPKFMLPGALVWLDELPMTAHGKIDESRLPAPGREDLPGLSAPATAATDLERRLTEIWQKVLSTARVGVQDNFFDLGGTSLKLALLHHRLRTDLGLDMPVHRLFEYPTIRALARAVTGRTEPSRSESSGPEPGAAPVDPRERAALARRALAARRPKAGN